MTDVELEDFDLSSPTASEISEYEAGELTLDNVTPAALLVLSSTTSSTFPYQELPPATAKQVKATAERIQGRLRTSYIDTGADLLAIKDKLEFGLFGKWLKAEFGWSPRTAENFMNAARLYGKSETVSLLPATVVYKLAARSTPIGVRDKVVADIVAGNVPTGAEINTWIEDAKAALKPRSSPPTGTGIQRLPGVAKSNSASRSRQDPVQAAEEAALIIQTCLGLHFEKVRKLLQHVDVRTFLNAINAAPAIDDAKTPECDGRTAVFKNETPGFPAAATPASL